MPSLESPSSELVRKTPIFVGVYRHSVDSKNRITVPSKWRQSESDELILTPSHDDEFLAVYPPDEFKARWKKVENNPDFSERDKAAFRLTFSARARDSVVDKQGRMVLPHDLCAIVGISQEILLLGSLTEFQVWSPDRWEARQAKEKENFSKIAASMGL